MAAAAVAAAIAKPPSPPKAVVAPTWTEHFTPEGKPYYSNGAETRWDRPPEFGGGHPSQPAQQQQQQQQQQQRYQPKMRPNSFVLPPVGGAVVQTSTRAVSMALPPPHTDVLGSDGEDMEFV